MSSAFRPGPAGRRCRAPAERRSPGSRRPRSNAQSDQSWRINAWFADVAAYDITIRLSSNEQRAHFDAGALAFHDHNAAVCHVVVLAVTLQVIADLRVFR